MSWSEIESGFGSGERGGTPLPRIPGSTVPPPPTPELLSDLTEFLNSSSSTGILLDDSEKPINCSLHADDLVIFSRSTNGLQTLLNKLESYCEKTELTVNLDFLTLCPAYQEKKKYFI